jgi:hypothetical protein
VRAETIGGVNGMVGTRWLSIDESVRSRTMDPTYGTAVYQGKEILEHERRGR